ncbi:TetR/AcrR family transcriptional regulator [Frankia sp. QA3]|uniref:TetR/AcrR family transcriptional regulator n=1 Tax=Frankia sp. QA3 TaxID=710111 RepID=UPI000269B8A1|nr:TetR/AcrR family transcriptional regulator [Frankia sp. QA3]EIV90798.1 transcriptional regulator [Frankia sp. QA3]
MPRTKPADERRADLLAAGAEMFMAKGVAATTLDDITRRAGVSKGLFYQYFPSKEGLVFALQEKYAIEFAAHVTAAAAERPDWPGKLDAAVLVCFEHFRVEEGLQDVLFAHLPGESAQLREGAGVVDPGHHAAHHRLVEAIAALLAAGVAAGAYRVDDVEATAVLFFTAMHAFDKAFRHDYELTDDRLLQATQRLVRGAAGLTEAFSPAVGTGAVGTGPAARADPPVTTTSLG